MGYTRIMTTPMIAITILLGRAGVPLINDKAETCGDLSEGPFQPEYVALHIRQMVREHGAAIWCGLGETAKGWHLTPTEARTLAKVLMEAADLTSIAPKMAPTIKAA